MRRRLSSHQPTQEQSGPYQFYTTMRRCPACNELLLSQERVSFGTTAKILHILGMSCYCMACNGRYRVSARAWMQYLPWILGMLVAGAGAGAIWAILRLPPTPVTTGIFLGVIAVESILLSRLLVISRWMWWRLVSIKKIFTYQEGGLL